MASSADAQVDPRILRALRHPVRQQILSSLCCMPASALELAEELMVPLSRIRRHLRVLVENDAVEQVEGGGEGKDERRYRAMMRTFLDDAHFAELPPERREILNQLTLRDIARRIEESMERGGFRHEQTHVSLTRLLLDDEGWQEAVDLLAGVLEEVMMIESESAQRSAQSGEELSGSVLSILHFGKAERL